MSSFILNEARAAFHVDLCDQILQFVTTKDHGRNARNADASNAASRTVANHLANALGAKDGGVLAGQTAGNRFEDITASFVKKVFESAMHARPGDWTVKREKSRNPLVIAKFSQYSHLDEVYKASKDNPQLAAVLGRDYSVASDVVVYKSRLTDEYLNQKYKFVDPSILGSDDLRSATGIHPALHASISCKWTIRSDRAQNSRTEAQDLIRKRKGRVPHISVVTAEPLPSRLSSLCLGTGDLDCVYHIALPELRSAVASLNQSEASSLLEIMVESKRLKDIADLPLDLLV